MNLKTVKKNEELALNGIAIDVERVDATLVAVTFTDKDGRVVVVRQGQYGGIQASVPAPPVTVTRWRLTGELKKLKVNELFETEYEATARRNELSEDPDDNAFSVEKCEVPE